jgi:hypothetical protein
MRTESTTADGFAEGSSSLHGLLRRDSDHDANLVNNQQSSDTDYLGTSTDTFIRPTSCLTESLCLVQIPQLIFPSQDRVGIPGPCCAADSSDVAKHTAASAADNL